MAAPQAGRGGLVVFIASETRSGSTWLSYVLGSHRRAAHLGEYQRLFQEPRSDLACRLCSSRGLPHCTILHGFEQVSAAQAYRFALARFAPLGVDTVIDCSKDLDWLESQWRGGAFGDDLGLRVIHLVRDPRGWLASERRRQPMTPAEGLQRWTAHAHHTRHRLEALGLPWFAITYDALCLEPEPSLAALSAFLGMPLATSQLDYWTCEHHGMGGNGAAFNNLAATGVAMHTGDNRFYRAHLRRRFHDRRWRDLEDAAELGALADDPGAREILRACGTSFERLDLLDRLAVA